MMRFCEITTLCRIPDEYPYVTVLGIHPKLWPELRKFARQFPEKFQLLARVKPKVDDWTVYVGCASEDARHQFDAAWG